MDPGETPLQCAIREVQEELHITVTDPKKMGELYFDMSTMPNIHCHVFMATEFTGTPTDTDEAIPMWKHVDEIPYDRMWDDDQFWLPQMIQGQQFIGRFIFDDETILWKDVVFDPVEASEWNKEALPSL